MMPMKMISFFILSAFFLNCSAIFLSCYSVPDNPDVSQIDAHLCTHILVIGLCTIDEDLSIVLPSIKSIKQYDSLKKQNHDLKILITLTPTNNRLMSKLVLDDHYMDNFVDNVTNFLIENNLDGFDIDWEFPVWASDAAKTDKKRFGILLKKLRQRFDRQSRKLLLTVAVSGPYTITKKSYDINTLNQYVDYVQIMNYDFHDFKRLQPVVGFNAPLYSEWYEIGIIGRMNSDYSTRYWIKNGMNRTKLVFGIPTYGKGYKLLWKHMHFPYAPAIGPSSGYGEDVAYSEACNLTQSDGYRYFWNKAAASAYLVKDRQWLNIEDARSVTIKTAYAKRMGLAGVMVFALHSDDFQGTCGSENYPLIRAMKSELLRE